MNRQHLSRGSLTILISLSLVAVSCNIYDLIDSPSGDEQILSAARACFDNGDLECAREMYNKISTETEQIEAEKAFLTLDEVGATMGVFMDAFGDGEGGEGVTKIAAVLAPDAGEELRIKIFSAYQQIDKIETTELKGLVGFAAGASLLAELLAEDAGLTGSADVLDQTDLANDPVSCLSLICGVDCNRTNSVLAPAATYDIKTNPSNASVANIDHGGSATLGIVHGAILAISEALNQIGAGGTFSSTLDFVTALGLLTPDAGGEPCFRQGLLDNGLGQP